MITISIKLLLLHLDGHLYYSLSKYFLPTRERACNGFHNFLNFLRNLITVHGEHCHCDILRLVHTWIQSRGTCVSGHVLRLLRYSRKTLSREIMMCRYKICKSLVSHTKRITLYMLRNITKSVGVMRQTNNTHHFVFRSLVHHVFHGNHVKIN